MLSVLDDLAQNRQLHALVAVEDVAEHGVDGLFVLPLVHEYAGEQHDVLVRDQVQGPVDALVLAVLRNLAELLHECVDVVHRRRAALLRRLRPLVRQLVKLLDQLVGLGLRLLLRRRLGVGGVIAVVAVVPCACLLRRSAGFRGAVLRLALPLKRDVHVLEVAQFLVVWLHALELAFEILLRRRAAGIHVEADSDAGECCGDEDP